MIFAESGETISGGNFHGEYPAKVSILTIHLVVFSEKFGLFPLFLYCRRWITWPLVCMS